ncbi:MAG: 50S ribosomal protein L6, partial [Phycisphaerales bacterium]
MSRIGKKPISVPGNVKVNLADNSITIEGPKGTLSYNFRPEVDVAYDEGDKSISVSMDEKLIEAKRSNNAYWG